jgi:hypothetical protein
LITFAKTLTQMKLNRSVLLAFGMLILVSGLYRAWEGRPFGFAPQIAMAIFGGAIIKDKRLAFILPLVSMLLSDVLYQALYLAGWGTIKGFYGTGQVINYLLFAGLTCFGFLMKRVNVLNVLGFSVSGSVLFFLSSNFAVWLGGGGYHRPKTVEGLMMCYGDGLAFFREYGLVSGFTGNMFAGDLFFCTLLFGGYYLVNRFVLQPQNRLQAG